MIIKKIKALCFVFLFSNSFLFASFAPTNFYRPYDINLRMSDWPDTRFKLGANFEYGRTHRGRNFSEDRCNVLSIYNETESSLAMLMGAKQGSDAYQLANKLIPAYSPTTDDGVRGHFKLDGRYEGADLTFYGKYKINDVFSGFLDAYFYVPVRYMEISEVKWTDQTKNVLNSDMDVHQYLTDNLENIVTSLGGPDLQNWKKTGLSDIVLMLWWYKDFKQMKEHLKNVRVNARFGLSIPSGSVKDEDKTFSLPLGNDGSWGIPMAVALDLDFVYKMRAGLEFELLFLFDETRERRLKIDENQTDYLLLNKGIASRSGGIAWKFNLYVQAQRFLGGLSAMIAYQFDKHDDDKLVSQSNDFSYGVINSAQSLKEWTMQNFIFQLNYDFFSEFKRSWFKPQISFFYKMPITGKRVINPHTIGAQFALNF